MGGGPTGIELGLVLTMLGTKVFVVEFLSLILNADDTGMTDLIPEVLKAEGAESYLGSAVQRTRDLGNERGLSSSGNLIGIPYKNDLDLGREPAFRSVRNLLSEIRKACVISPSGVGLWSVQGPLWLQGVTGNVWYCPEDHDTGSA